MVDQPTFGDFVLGLEGLAILRSWMTDPPTVKARSKEIVEIAGWLEEAPCSNAIAGVERTVIHGYGEWATTYDNYDNPVILTEEPVVRKLLARHPKVKHLMRLAAPGGMLHIWPHWDIGLLALMQPSRCWRWQVPRSPRLSSRLPV